MKKAVCALASVVCIGLMSSCGSGIDTDVGTHGSPDGKWELVEAESEGKVLNAEKENWFEQFDISGAAGTYTVKYQGLDKTYDITVEKLDGDKYDIKMRGMISMGTAEFGTSKMVYRSGEGKNASTLVYVKK